MQLSSGYESSSCESSDSKKPVHYLATLPRKISSKNESSKYSNLNSPCRTKMHVPTIRRDIQPEKDLQSTLKWPSMNAIRKSVSEMHLSKDTSHHNISAIIDKTDTDSDTGISSLHSSDNECFLPSSYGEIKCETLV